MLGPKDSQDRREQLPLPTLAGYSLLGRVRVNEEAKGAEEGAGAEGSAAATASSPSRGAAAAR